MVKNSLNVQMNLGKKIGDNKFISEIEKYSKRCYFHNFNAIKQTNKQTNVCKHRVRSTHRPFIMFITCIVHR